MPRIAALERADALVLLAACAEKFFLKPTTSMIFRLIATLAWVFLLAIVDSPSARAQAAPEAVRLTHVHGLFYSADGTRLQIPGHRGIAVFERGQWTRAPGDGSDFAGFTAARDVWFASGHPGLAADSSDLLGLGRSTDGGKTWQTMGFSGEADFHHMAAGYRSAMLYLFNTSSNSKMRQPGLYRSPDKGARWYRASSQGLSGEIEHLAVHPDDPATVAVGTSRGLYLSRDGAESFVRVGGEQRVFAVAMAPSGDTLWYSTYSKRARMVMKSLGQRGAEHELILPAMHGDAVAFIAFNPVAKGEVAIATTRRNVFVSRNAGKDWHQIVHEGDTHG